MTKNTRFGSNLVNPVITSLTLIIMLSFINVVGAQTTTPAPRPNAPTSSSASSDLKSINNTKADVNELTYVANAENCTPKALHPSLDHGPRATTSSWLNGQRVAECYGRVR